MTAELSNNGSKKKPRHPWDWYIEEQWVTHALADMIELESHVDYLDPFCGQGNIPLALIERGLRAFGTDLFARTDAPFFIGQHDFLGPQRHMMEASPALSIIMNPPFSVQNGKMRRGLSLKIIKRALELATHKVCALVPLKWLASETRFAFFTDTKPTILVFSERPSMPPGDMIADLGDDAYRRGKVDYIWLIWDKKQPPVSTAQTLWIPPRLKLGRTKQRQLELV